MMNNSDREIRVFLSSTFRDMDAERTYLVKQVFPKVRAACLERQVGFSEIDLRWGVLEEEAKNGATVEICLKEIDRCRDFPPFFIGFLGERYGWVPRHDELQSYWGKRSDTKYEEQILEAVKQCVSVTELEMELAVLNQGVAIKIADHALFCLRDAKLTDQLYQLQTGEAPNHTDPDFYDAGQGKLDALKDKIRRSGFLGLDNYTTVEQFGAVVESYLLGQLDRYFPTNEVPTPLQRTNAAHQAFRFHRLQNFLPRTDVREQMIQSIEQRIESPYLGPILVTGPSGQGKSALMADLARHLKSKGQKTHNQNNPDETWRVIDHYVGADSANHLDGWVDRILNILHPDIKDIAGDIPESPKDKVEVLSTWISMSARRHNYRHIFILDAIDQLSDGGKNLEILSVQTLGPDGILIASAADGTHARQSAEQWQTLLEVPPLTSELKAKLIQDTLGRYRKKLPPELTRKLAEAPQSGSPLFLILALEELRVDARHETLASTTFAILKQPDAEHLFLNHFLLDADNGRDELPELAASFMALLGASRAGLSEIELADLLAQPDDPIAEDTGKPRMPQVYLSKLINNLAPFLINKQGRRAPMHRILGEVALNYYGTWPVREHLYAHFESGYGRAETEYEARYAAEALSQITELAKHSYPIQKQARKQLIADLGYLQVPVKLHYDEVNNGESLIIAAIRALVDEEQQQIAKLYEKEIGKFDAEEAENSSWHIGYYGDWLKNWGCFSLALSVLEPCLIKQVQILPLEHLAIANGCNSLGLLYQELARFPEAIPLIRRALAIRESQLGAAHPATATCINNLAGLLSDQGDYAGAETLYRRALAIRESQLDAAHPTIATSLNNLAVLLSYQGDYSGAETLCRRALAITENQLGSAHPATATNLNNLAGFLRDQGDYAGAEPLYRRALAIRESQLGGGHPYTAASINNLALLLQDSGDYAGAESLCRRALAIWESQFGAEHPYIATSLNNLAALLQTQGDYAAAAPLYWRALAIHESRLEAAHPDTATCLDNLARLLSDQGDFSGAEPLCRRALAIRESRLGVEHPDTATSLNNLATLLQTQGDYVASAPLYQRALAICERKYGEVSFQAGSILYSLGCVLGRMGQFDKAEVLLRRELKISTELSGEEDKRTLRSIENLAGLFEEKKDIDASAALKFKLLTILEKTVGKQDGKTLHILQNLAVMLRNAGKLEEAEPLQREAVARFINVYGVDDLQTGAAYSGLGALLKLKGEYEEAESFYRKVLAIRERELGTDAEPTKLVRRRLEELLINGR